jgi:predicted nucleic-acid-binding Zn-ribbon protein
MENTIQCPDCGLKATRGYEPPYQEYPGASAQGGYYYVCCDECGYADIERDSLDDHNWQENTRGW